MHGRAPKAVLRARNAIYEKLIYKGLGRKNAPLPHQLFPVTFTILKISP